MPTVIDSLIIELGLDPSKFTKGQKDALKSLHDAKEQAVRAGNDIESAGKKGAESLGLLQNKLLGIGSLIVSGLGLQRLVTDITKQDAATARLSYTLGTNVTVLDKWRNAAYLVGGSAEGITGSIQGLVNHFQDFAITGESSVIPWFRALNVNIADTEGKMRPFQEIMVDLANAFQKLDPVKAAAFGRNMGLDAGTVNLLVKGGDELTRILALSEKFGNLTPQQAENARKLAEAFNQLSLAATEWSRVLLNAVTPALIKVSETSSKIIADRGNIDKRSLFGRALEYLGLGKREEKSSISGSTAFSSDAEKEAFIRSEAAKRGVSPDVAMAVARSEGFKSYVGDQGTSFGAFQLHYKNNIPGLSLGGLGDEFTKATGKHASDPSTEREQIQFALDKAKEGGWGPWHGWKGDRWAGIDRGGGGSHSETKIGTIIVNTQATDANGIAASIGPAIQRNGLAAQSQAGPQ